MTFRRCHTVVWFGMVIPVLSVAADHYQVTQEDRQSEVEWLTSLGVQAPERGPVLSEPFAEPFTKRSFVVPASWWRTPQPRELQASMLRQDLALLHMVMEKAYGGWESAARRGWDWNRWFGDWDRDLAAKGDARLGLADALAPFERLERFQLDNHSGPTGGVYFGSGSQTAVLQSAPSGTCSALRMSSGETAALDVKDPATAPKPAKIVHAGEERPADGFYISYPARRGTAAAVECGGKWISLETWGLPAREKQISALAQKPGGQPSYRMVAEDIGYLRVPTLSKKNSELWTKMLPTLPESAGRERLLIVDLRMNDGGDEQLGALDRWVDLSAIQSVVNFSRTQPKSCLYDALRWGYTQMTSLGLQPPLSDGLRNMLQGQLNGLFQPGAEGCPMVVERTRSKWNYTQHRFPAAAPVGRPWLMLLTDGGCASDCEFMIYVLAAAAGSVVVGESTYGVGQFVQPGYFVLPHTRLHFRIALGRSDFYGDDRSFDGYGLGPDIVLAGEDAYAPETILRLARTLIAQ